MPDRQRDNDESSVVASPDDDVPLTVGGSMAVIETQRQRAARRVNVSPTVLSAIWAVAWFVGFGCAYLAYGPGRVIPALLGPVVPAVLIAVAFVASIVYSNRVGSGITGPSRTSATMYGWAWTISSLCLTVVNLALTNRDMPEHTAILLWSSSYLFLVGVMHLAGGALWSNRVEYGMGIWTLASAAGAVFAGVPGTFLVLSLAGGGGFAAMALYYWLVSPHVARRRS